MVIITDLPLELLTLIFDYVLPESVTLTVKGFSQNRPNYAEPVINPALALRLVCPRFDTVELIRMPTRILRLNDGWAYSMSMWFMFTSLEHRATFSRLETRAYSKRALALDLNAEYQRILNEKTDKDRAVNLNRYYAMKLCEGYKEVELLWSERKGNMDDEYLHIWESADWELKRAKAYRTAVR